MSATDAASAGSEGGGSTVEIPRAPVRRERRRPEVGRHGIWQEDGNRGERGVEWEMTHKTIKEDKEILTTKSTKDTKRENEID
jgi:hypothetical protein